MDYGIYFGLNKNEYILDPYIVIPEYFFIDKYCLQRKKNKFLYHKVLKKEIIYKNEIIILNVIGDGNCYFRNLSLYFTNNENYHIFFRELLYIYINKNKEDIIKENPYHLYKDKLIKVIDYIPLIKKEKNFAGELEIAQSIFLYKINIAIYIKDNATSDFKFYNYYYITNSDFINDLLILIYDERTQHYYQIIYNDSINLKTNFNNNNKVENNKNIYKNQLINDIYEIIKKYKQLDITDNNKQLINSNIKEKKSFKELWELGYRYPNYPNHIKGELLLLYIRTYLLSKKNNRSPIYPNYILDINNETSLENAKRYFRNIAKNYHLDDNNELYIKKYKNDKNKITNEKEYYLLKVPFTRDLKGDIYNIHKNIGHKNAKIVRQHIISKN